MSMSTSNSNSSIKATELGKEQYQKMINEENRVYRLLKSAMDRDSPEDALDYLALVLGIDISVPRYEAFVTEHIKRLPKMAKECRKLESFKPFISILVRGGLLEDPDAGRYTINQQNIERAWVTRYEGDVHRQVLHIVLNERASEAYRNSAALLQSSGYGKSRTLGELENLIATMPMNVHPKEAHSGTYPRPDEPLLALLTGIGEKWYATSRDAVNALHTFFAILFERIKEEMVSLKLNERDVGAFALIWQEHLQTTDRREAIYNDVESAYGRRQLTGYLKSSDAVQRLRELLALMPAILKVKKNQADLRFIMYMDEAHSLAQAPMHIMDSKFTLLEILNKALAKYVEYGMFFLFASTTSLVDKLSPPKTLLDSTRRTQARPIEPIIEMCFDCHRALRSGLQPGTLRLEDVQQFLHSARFGRPLFWTLLESYPDYETGNRDNDVLGLAAMKLAGTLNYSPLHADIAKLAVLDVLLNIDYHRFRPGTFDLKQKMVSSHMRTVFTARDSQSHSHSGYPSEPVLAEAAMNIVYLQDLQVPQVAPLSITHSMTPATPQALDDPIALMFSSLGDDTSGAIDMGDRGENVGKILLLQAYMNAVKESDLDTPWRHGCSVISFLRHLLVQTEEANVECFLPDNVMDGMELKEAFKDSWIRFTHFARGADESAVTSSMAYAAFLRGMAVIGCNSSGLADVMIPILLRKDVPICEDVMSGLLVQFRCRRRPGLGNAYTMEESDIGFFPPKGSERDNGTNTAKETKELYATRPYITLAMELGVVPTASSGARAPTGMAGRRHSNSLPHSPSGVTIPGPQNASLEQHPRYSISVHGCDSDVYRCIPHSNEAAERLRRLLYVGGLLSDHARAYTTEHIRGLKPFWSAGRACFSWVSDEFLNAEF